VCVEELLHLATLCFHLGAERHQPGSMYADILQASNLCTLDVLLCVANQVTDEPIEYSLEGFVELQLLQGAGKGPLDFRIVALENTYPQPDAVQGKQAGFEAIVQVGGAVGNLVGQIDELCFQGRPLIQAIVRQLWKLGGTVISRMFDDALAHFEREIQAGKRGIALFEILDDPEGMEIVVERQTVIAHYGVESFLSCMSKGRMAEIVRQREGFNQVNIEAKLCGQGAGDLSDFDGVRQAIAKMVGISASEDLRLMVQPAERAGMNDPVAVAFEVVTVGMARLWITASTGLLDAHGIGSEHGERIASKNWRGVTQLATAGVLELVRSKIKGRGSDRALLVIICWWLFRVVFCQPYFGRFQFLLHFGYVRRFNFRGNGFVPLRERTLPVHCSQSQAAGLLINVAHVILNSRIVGRVLQRLTEIGFRQVVLAHLEVGPA